MNNKDKKTQTADQVIETVPQEPERFAWLKIIKEKIIQYKKLATIAAIFVFIIILLAAASTITKKRQASQQTPEKPTPTTTEANGFPFQKIIDKDLSDTKDNLDKIEAEISGSDIGESSLNLPVLDWDTKLE